MMNKHPLNKYIQLNTTIKYIMWTTQSVCINKRKTVLTQGNQCVQLSQKLFAQNSHVSPRANMILRQGEFALIVEVYPCY